MTRRLAGLTELVSPSGAFDSIIVALEIVMSNLPADHTKLPLCPYTNVYLSICYSLDSTTYSALTRETGLQLSDSFTWSGTVSKLVWPLILSETVEALGK